MRQNDAIMPGKDKFLATNAQNYTRFFTNLQKKLSIAFNSEAGDVMAFFDLSGKEQLRIDEFLFGVEFFIQGNRLKECLQLFQELDVNCDGVIDVNELDGLFYLSADKDLTGDAR